MSLTVILPWPAAGLSPNDRTHWAAKATRKKAQRADAHLLTLASGSRAWAIPEGRLHLWITFHPPDRRRRDADNVLASCKSALDGVADALGVDDSRFVLHPLLKTEPRKGGAVEIRITGGPA